MASVKEHYDHFLAPCYSWMSGGFALKREKNRTFLNYHHILPQSSKIAVDLGAGPGFHSIPLAEAGFKVVAIDLNQELLRELRQNDTSQSVVTVQDDLLNFTKHIPPQIEVIVCMGDVLLHLQRLEDVRNLLEKAYQALADKGRLVLSFRDLSRELHGLDRFIPVMSDTNTIFTCFLEYEEKYVKVHDILYKMIDNQWEIKKSFFRKLRISPSWARTVLEEIGFTIETDEVEKGLVILIARRP